MHLKATRGKEVVVRIINDIGVLADLAKVLADRGIDLKAINASVLGDQATIRVVTDDNLRAVDVLGEHGYNPQESSMIVLTLSHKPGMLHRVSEELAHAMLDIRHIYASSVEGQDECCVILHTANDDRALVRLNQME